MKQISGFKMDGTLDKLIDEFKEMVMDIMSLRLVERLGYAESAQFMERLEEGGNHLPSFLLKVRK